MGYPPGNEVSPIPPDGKRNIIFKHTLGKGHVSSQEGMFLGVFFCLIVVVGGVIPHQHRKIRKKMTF